MAVTIKHKKIDLKFVKKNYPILSATLDEILKKEDVSEETKQRLSGLCIEIALKSNGTVDLFEDDLPEGFLDNDLDM